MVVMGLVQFASGVGAGLRQKDSMQASVSPHILKTIDEVPFLMRMCNAYASSSPLEVHVGKTAALVTPPLPYKQCRDISIPLRQGEDLNFHERRNGVVSLIGAFAVRELPGPGSTLLLIPHRRSPHSTSMTFASHVFAETASPQIAVLDVYDGTDASSALEIEERSEQHANASEAELGRREPLEYNSVVSLTPGEYQLTASKDAGKQQGLMKKGPVPLSVKGTGVYVIMRVGATSHRSGTDKSSSGLPTLLEAEYPEEIVVFPQLGSESAAVPRALSIIVVAVASLTMLIGGGTRV